MDTIPELDWIWIGSGLAVGLLGWLLYWAGVPLIGAALGAGAGGALGFLLSGFIQAPWAETFLTGVGLVVGGVAGILLIRALQLYFFFATGASLGGAYAWQLLGREPLAGLAQSYGEWAQWLVVGLGALVGGLLLIQLRRFIVAVVTSVVGAIMFTHGVPPQHQTPALIISLIVFIAVQIGIVRRFIRKEEFDKYTRFRLRDDSPDVGAAD